MSMSNSLLLFAFGVVAIANSGVEAGKTATISPAPVIGILSFPNGDKQNTSSIVAGYVQWLESAGARVVPIKYDLAFDELKDLFSKINGVLFTGGPAKPLLAPKPYFQTATALYNLVKESHSNGDSVPLWGTCLGIQTISCIASGGVDVTGNFPLNPYSYPLDFTSAANSSRMFGQMSPQLWGDFSFNVTTNWHSYGVSPTSIKERAPDLTVLATNVALNGERFVSALEGANGLPVYSVQFHPEGNQWIGGVVSDDGIEVPSRSAQAIRTVQYLSSFIVEQARKNSHHFESMEAMNAALIQNFNYSTYVDTADAGLYGGGGWYNL